MVFPGAFYRQRFFCILSRSFSGEPLFMQKNGFTAHIVGFLILAGNLIPSGSASAQVAGDRVMLPSDSVAIVSSADTSLSDTSVPDSSADMVARFSLQNEVATVPDTEALQVADSDDVPVDSVEHVDPSVKEDYPRLSREEYQYAEHERYTLLGEPPYRRTHIQTVPALITGGLVGGIITGIHLYQQDAWWSDRRQDFHFRVDWGYAAQADKFGHFFAGYFSSYVGYEALVASGCSREMAGWLGPLLAVGFQTYVEIEDGFSPFGFDPTDQVGNMLGPIIFSAQNYIPALQHFKFKWSYFPEWNLPDDIESGHNTIVIDDYNGQDVWLSLKMGTILPESAGWPKWLRLAIGYGAYNVDRWRVNEKGERVEYLLADRRVTVSLDYDLPELLPDMGSFGNWLVQTADYIHFPAPAIQIVPEFKFLLIYPIKF